ncbi:MAG: Fe-S cluster assembly protein SufD [Gemmatimonadetes bacterium]|nr:Fe-S cluster assembly protein SufD [Gemmatimonadota bacterium]
MSKQAPDGRDHYLADFRKFTLNGGAHAPAWLMELRERAAGQFAKIGFPTVKEEAWRFTSVSSLLETPFTPARSDVVHSASALAGLTVGGDAGNRLVFVNGRFESAPSSVRGLPPGVRFESLQSALETSPEVVRKHLGQHARFDENGFTALSTAFVRDGAFLHIPRGVDLRDPLEILFLSAPVGGAWVSHPRILIVVDEGARGVVVERYAGADTGPYFTNTVTELVLGDGARLDHCRVQQEGASAYHLAATHSTQGRDSVLESCSVALGSALTRHDIGAVMNGAGGNLILNGLTLAGGRQHIDHHTTIDHAQPHCESHELFNGIFDEQSRGVFTGRIIVRPGAQRTDSKQTNNNLLLSPEARADSQPQLEIYADDVKCTHGATLGPVDDAAMFYLRSRGLDALEARNLLTYGFAADVISRLGSEAMRSHLYPVLLERLCRQRTGATA